eukprot:759922-Hanusia_phi.AAC.1
MGPRGGPCNPAGHTAPAAGPAARTAGGSVSSRLRCPARPWQCPDDDHRVESARTVRSRALQARRSWQPNDLFPNTPQHGSQHGRGSTSEWQCHGPSRGVRGVEGVVKTMP